MGVFGLWQVSRGKTTLLPFDGFPVLIIPGAVPDVPKADDATFEMNAILPEGEGQVMRVGQEVGVNIAL